jgi:hypothetical protein
MLAGNASAMPMVSQGGDDEDIPRRRHADGNLLRVVKTMDEYRSEIRATAEW